MAPGRSDRGTPPTGAPGDPRAETKQLARAAREARILTQIEACKMLEKHAFKMAEAAREADLVFLVYLFEMARVAAVDERARLSRS